MFNDSFQNGKSIDRLDYSIASHYKSLGWIIAGLAFAVLIIGKFSLSLEEVYKDVLRLIILVGMFLTTVARDKNADELTEKLRLKAFATAFLWGTVMWILAITFSVIISGVFKNDWSFPDINYFAVIFTYIMMFHLYNFIYRTSR